MKMQPTVTVEYDLLDDGLVAGYMRLREGKVARTVEVAPELVLIDLNSRGALLGVEILGPCKVAVLERIARKYHAPALRGLARHPRFAPVFRPARTA